jgi:ABC-type Fe3+-hydroxamate transport system substrate-binding protein
LQTLEDIDLYSLPKAEIHFSVERLLKLESLRYTTVSGLMTIRGIEELPKLIYLALSQVKVIDGDYSPIVQSKSLERVFWFGSPFKTPALKELRTLRPDIVIGGNSYNEEYYAKKRMPNA